MSLLRKVFGKKDGKGKSTTKVGASAKAAVAKVDDSADIGVATWNILADGLGLGEFMTNGGDEVCCWKNRGPKIASGIHALLSSDVAIVATQENDHPYWILEEIKKKKPSVRMEFMVKNKNAPKFYANRLCDYLTDEEKYSKGDKSAFKNGDDKPDLVKIGKFLDVNPQVRDELTGKGMTCTTFAEECFKLPSTKSGGDLYNYNDCLAVYYDSDVVQIDENLERGEFGEIPQNPENLLCLDFIHTKDSSEYKFTVLAAHLKSGEDEKGEIKRVKELRALLEKATTFDNPIVLMDSNTCVQYTETIKRNFDNKDAAKNFVFVKELFESKGFKSTVAEDEVKNKAIKMRHAQGKQPKKFGELFFDTIDKILVLDGTTATSISLEDSVSSDLKLFPNEHADFIDILRTNVEMRKKLHDVCVEEKWGPDMSINKTEKFDEFVKNETTFNNFGSVKDVLMGLYPNEHMPSDHPPVVAKVTVKRFTGGSK